MESRKHRQTAERIAAKKRTSYNPDKGVDIVTPTQAIEVETSETVRGGIRQLQGHRRSAYIAGVDKAAVEAALDVTEGTTVGVMDKDGNIVKRSTRRRR